MLKTESTTVDDIEFKTTQLPAMRAFALLARLVKLIGPAMGALAGMDMAADLTTAAPALAGALSGLDPDEATELARQILVNTTALVRDQGGGLREVSLNSNESINQIFSGRVRAMLTVLVHAIRVNYQDFSVGSAPAAPKQTASSGG